MTRVLENTSALVTGASGGIGRAVAHALARAGSAVAVHYFKNQAGAEEIALSINEEGGCAIVVGGDVGEADQAQAIAGQAAEAFGSLDILVNTSGTLQNLPFGAITPDAFQEQFSTNVLGAILMTQACVLHFPAQGGRVVNFATNLAYGPLPGTAVYAAAKAAIITLTQGFARELAPRGVTVNAVAPGAIDTPMLDWLTDDMRASIAQATPLGRMGRPDDVADIVVFLASPAARWMTGRTLIVDGGLV